MNEIKIKQYDTDDNFIAEYQDFADVAKDYPNYKSFYYRYSEFDNASRQQAVDKHFGIEVKSIGSNSLNQADMYNDYLNMLAQHWDLNKNERVLFYTFAYSKKIKNELTRMKSIPYVDFFDAINKFVKESDFKSITDLKECNGMSGIYMLVLEKYHQCYIGQSRDIKKRVVEHWCNTKNFNVGIDLFKALDTNQIYVKEVETSHLNEAEISAINSIEPRYLLNHLIGGDSIGFLKK